MKTLSRRRCGLAILPAALVFAGCSRTSVTTEVRPDGTWKRTVEFRAAAPDKNGGLQMNMSPPLDQQFALPHGPEWKAKRTEEKGEVVYAAEQTLKAGQAIRQDIAVRGGTPQKPEMQVTNSVSVRELAPGRWEYREVLHWAGARPKDAMEMKTPDDKAIQEFRKALPANLVTDADIQDLARILVREIWQMLFGPPDPLVGQLLSSPEFVMRRMQRRLALALDHALREKYGDRLTAEQRLAAVRKMTASAESSMTDARDKVKQKSDPTAKQPGDNSGLVSMLFTVKLPGRIVSTNGEIDEINGQVSWALYHIACAPEDVTLTAVCDTTPPK